MGYDQVLTKVTEKKCVSNFLIVEDGTLCGRNWNKMSKARIAAYSEGSASVFCFWLAKFWHPGNKTKALPFDVYKGFVLGEKISTLSPCYEEIVFELSLFKF